MNCPHAFVSVPGRSGLDAPRFPVPYEPSVSGPLRSSPVGGISLESALGRRSVARSKATVSWYPREPRGRTVEGARPCTSIVHSHGYPTRSSHHRSEDHTSELTSLMRTSYAGLHLQKNTQSTTTNTNK